MGIERYVQKRDDAAVYRYRRRVPTHLRHLDKRTFVTHSLKTSDHAEAYVRARSINDSVEAYWASLEGGRSDDAEERYHAALKMAAALSIPYRTVDLLAAGAIDEIIERMLLIRSHGNSPDVGRVALGVVSKPEITLGTLWDFYAEKKKAEFKGFSPNQLRKHEIPRQRAIRYAIEKIGDKGLAEITRDDVLDFRDWWSEKLLAEGLKADTLNRSFTDLRGMIAVVDDALRTNFRDRWEKTRVRETNATKAKERLPFASEYVQRTLLKPGCLDGMREQARMAVYGMIETGLSPSEICNLRRVDIHLRAKIPHISIPEREDRRLKTDYRPRSIPLVGVSLWAFQQSPGGFPKYADKEDSFSTAVNKFMRSNDLFPSRQHSLYSFRHTFQDRLTASGANDRLQVDLMGHDLGRPDYGDGASLEQKLELLDRIKFEWTPPTQTNPPPTTE